VIVLVEVWKLVGNFARLICPLPGQTNSARKFHSYNHNNKRFFFVFLLLSKNKFIPCCDDERCASVESVTTSTPVNQLYRSCIVHLLCLSRIFLRYTAVNHVALLFHPHPSTKYPQVMQSIFTRRLREKILWELPTRNGHTSPYTGKNKLESVGK